MVRHQVLYTTTLGTDGRRHLLHGSGPDGFPRALCGDRIVLRDAAAPACRECELVRLTEMTLALEQMGQHELAVELARAANAASFETAAAQTT